MNELVTHIQNLNAKTQAWVNEDPKNRFAGMLVDEPEHWARYDVHTVAQFEHYMAATELYEATKSKYGYKPDWRSLKAMSTEELVEALRKLWFFLKKVAGTCWHHSEPSLLYTHNERHDWH